MPQEVTRRCHCGCCRIVVTKWEGSETFPTEYAMELETSINDTSFSFFKRLKTAFLMVLGKKVNHAESVFENEEVFVGFLNECADLVAKKEKCE